ncbi:hypothetical protein F4805DRAFT_451668 [Annulohypoxylon moriforme]|nr:hypothetical protein F4805DRAFT_451668 [Annulohypoxylon moriforme]
MGRGIRKSCLTNLTSGYCMPCLFKADSNPFSQLMFSAMTFYFTDDPEWRPRVCGVPMPDGEIENLETWAPYLVGEPVYDEFKPYSLELRSLIARCMADNPDERPTLDVLLDIIEDNIRRGDEAAAEDRRRSEEDPDRERPPVGVVDPPEVESDELLARWDREYILEPIVRDDPYADYWDS